MFRFAIGIFEFKSIKKFLKTYRRRALNIQRGIYKCLITIVTYLDNLLGQIGGLATVEGGWLGVKAFW